MAKKTPEQRIEELDAKRDQLEKKLKAEREAIVRAKRRECAKVLNKNRRDDTRRKILIGAKRLDGLNKMDKDTQIVAKRRLRAEMESFLTRKADRALFGLPPIEIKDPD